MDDIKRPPGAPPGADSTNSSSGVLKRLSVSGAKPGKGWLTNGFWAVADQGLFAGSNFALNILLGRWLTEYEYGAFSLAFAIFLFLGVLHTATLTEPMLVFGPGRYKERLPEYLGSLVYGHLGLAVLGGLALFVAGLGFALWGASSLAAVLMALALAGPFVLLLLLMRRACYASFEPRLAALAGAGYMALMLVGAYALYWFGWLSPATALGVMGVSSLAMSLWLMARLRVELPRGGGLIRDSLKSHWEYGRWSVANRGMYWLPGNIYYLLLPVWFGLTAGASFKALTNLTMPMLQTVTALTVLLLPSLVRAREQSRFDASVRLYLIPLVLASALYWVLLGLFHDQVVYLAYGGKYMEYAGLLWVLGFAPIALAASEVFAQALRALERPDALFRAYAIYAVVGGVLAVAFMYEWGIVGAAVGMLFSRFVAVALTAVVLWFVRRGRPRAPSEDMVLRAQPAREGAKSRR